MRSLLLLVCCVVSSLSFGAGLNGAGSTAAASLYGIWSKEWAAKKGTPGIEYAAVGSSAGLKAVLAGKVLFGASDVAPPRDLLDKEGLVVFPTAISGVVPVVNLPGIGAGKLKLTGLALADLLTGKISRWDAPELKKLNPGVALPSLPVKVVVREDGSGTTYVLSHYLSRISEDWKAKFGNDFLIKWPEGVTAVKGGGKVAETVKEISGAIGYVEYGQAIEGSLSWVLVQNRKERWVEPGQKSFAEALRGTGWTRAGEFEEMLTDSGESGAWPITAGTFIIMKRTQSDPAAAAQVLSFFTWAFMYGDPLAEKLRWIPLPQNTQARVVKEMSKLHDKAGNPVPFAYVQ